MIEPLRLNSSFESNPGLKIQAKQARRLRPLDKKIVNKKMAIAGVSGLVVVGLSLDWQLVIATGMAIAVMSSVYNAQSNTRSWQQIGRRLSQFGRDANSKLAIAVALGGGSMLLVYAVLAIWNSHDNHWLGFAESTQFLAIMGILALLLRQFLQSDSQTKSLENSILDLGSANNLQRLIAVRQLQQSALKSSPEQQQAIAEYCQVLLSDEKFVPVREATFELLESLQTSVSVHKLISD